jgi:transposase
MPAPYSTDLRERVIRCYEQGELGQEAVAKRFSVSVRTFKRWWKRYETARTIAPARLGGRRKPKVEEARREQIGVWLQEKSDLTLRELCQRYKEHVGVSMSHSAMARGLKRLKVSRKKNVL